MERTPLEEDAIAKKTTGALGEKKAPPSNSPIDAPESSEKTKNKETVKAVERTPPEGDAIAKETTGALGEKKAPPSNSPIDVPESSERTENKETVEAVERTPLEEKMNDATLSSDDRIERVKARATTNALLHLEGELKAVWVLSPYGIMVQLDSVGTSVAPGVYETYADLGNGRPEPVGLTMTVRSGEKVTVYCNKQSARCSIRAVTP